MTPEFDSVWMGLWRFNIIANTIFCAVTSGGSGYAGPEPGQPGPQDGAEAVLLLDGLVSVLHLGRVLRGQLHVRAGCGVAPSHHPGHELHREPYHGVLLDVPAVHHMRRGELPVCADAVAAVPQATSFPLVAAVVGPMFILPNVGLNEWGHAFWFVDELFSAPLHWGFVTLGWCGLFGGTGGVAAQIVAGCRIWRRGLEQREQGLLARDSVLNLAGG